jgi:single-stranded DNA-binding protein
MTAFVLISGSLWKTPEQRTGRTGKLYTVATIRAGSDDSSASEFWSITAFSESAQAELLRLGAGDALSAQGKARFELYTSNTGAAKISRSIVADAVLPLRPAPREKKPKAAAAPTSQDQTTTTTDPGLDDEIPF